MRISHLHFQPHFIGLSGQPTRSVMPRTMNVRPKKRRLWRVQDQLAHIGVSATGLSLWRVPITIYHELRPEWIDQEIA